MAESLSLLIHGNAKIGKSTLTDTSPPPLCVFDTEGSWKFLRLKYGERCKAWDPVREATPQYDGTWDVTIIEVDSFETFKSGYEKLVMGNHQFRSIIVDSLTELQRKLKTSLVGDDKMEWGDYDVMLRKLDVVTRGLRDLTQHPTNPVMVAMFVCETKKKDDKWMPNLQGAIANSAPYWFDIVGYFWVEAKLDGNGCQVFVDGKKAKTRKLLISPENPLFEAGSRVQELLPDVIEDPHVSRMLVTVFPSLGGK